MLRIGLKTYPRLYKLFFFGFALVILLILTLDALLVRTSPHSVRSGRHAECQKRVLYVFGLVFGAHSHPTSATLSVRLAACCLLFICSYRSVVFPTHYNQSFHSFLCTLRKLVRPKFRLLALVMSSLIKTNLVLLDLSDVSDDLEHMIRTNRKPCWNKGENYLNSFREAEHGTVFRRLWEMDDDRSRCLVGKDTQSFLKIKEPLLRCGIIEDIYLLVCMNVFKTLAFVPTNVLSSYRKGLYFNLFSGDMHITPWLSPKPVKELLQALYIAKKSPIFKGINRLK